MFRSSYLIYGTNEQHEKKCDCGELEKIERQRRLENVPNSPLEAMGEIKLSQQPVFATTGHRKPITAITYDAALQFVEYVGSMKGIILNGGAAGWDTLVAFYCAEHEVPYKLYLPFESSRNKVLKKILTAAQEIIIVGGQEFSTLEDYEVYQQRNEMMVNLANQLHSYHDGRKKGGTINCINYAKKNGVKIKNWFPNQLADLV